MRSIVHTITLGTLFACFAAGCQSGEQPEVCEAFLVCFYPEDRTQSPDFLDDRPQSDQLAEDAEAAFGRDGECWKNGSGDRFYEICEKTCRDVIADECAQGVARPCIRSENQELLFDPPDSAWQGEPFQCSDFEEDGGA